MAGWYHPDSKCLFWRLLTATYVSFATLRSNRAKACSSQCFVADNHLSVSTRNASFELSMSTISFMSNFCN